MAETSLCSLSTACWPICDDWNDCTAWPQVPGALSLPKLAVKQGDPEGKTGVVGAFCRTYDIYRAMDELIPGIYEPVDNMPGRYTYLGGSTTGGAVIYDNGKFLYSHHATDPCSGRLVNAFDMVRLHRFGDKDDEAQPGTPPTACRPTRPCVSWRSRTPMWPP